MPLGVSHRYILIAFYCGTCEDFAAFPVLLSDFARYELTVMLLQRTPQARNFLAVSRECGIPTHFSFELKHGWRALFL